MALFNESVFYGHVQALLGD